MVVPLINLYPMQQAPHAPALIQQQEAMIKYGCDVKPLPELIHINDPNEHVYQALNNFSTNILPRMIYEKLSSLLSYKSALQQMPNLSSVKGLSDYRKRFPNYNTSLVNNELHQYGVHLSSGQILFHGGIYPKDVDNAPMQSFITDRPLSTTLCAQVASVHSNYHQPNELWIIRVASNSTTKAFVFNNDTRQTHGHETEVLFATGAKVTLSNHYQVQGYSIFELELA